VSDDGFIRVAALAELPEGALLAVALPDGTPICLANHRGAVRAFHDECPHAAFAMSDGQLHADGTIECVWHGARFACGDGGVLRGPATDALTMYDVKVEGGEIFVARRT